MDRDYQLRAWNSASLSLNAEHVLSCGRAERFYEIEMSVDVGPMRLSDVAVWMAEARRVYFGR